MSDIADSTSPIQLESVLFRSPVSESLLQLIGGGINGAINRQFRFMEFTAAGTTSWTVPTGVTQIYCWGMGGGGGGGGGSVSNASNGGGGEGCRLSFKTLTVTPGAVLTVVIGAGGTAGTTGGTSGGNGGTGGTTSIDVLSFVGGQGGRGSNATAGPGGQSIGGFCWGGTGADTVSAVAASGLSSPFASGGAPASGGGGGGGASDFGSGGQGEGPSGVPSVGNGGGPGAGGGGGSEHTSSAGGVGGIGYLLIAWFGHA